MGVSSSSALYQASLTTLLKDILNRDVALLYQDDLLLASTSLQHHLDTLRAVFQKYDEANIRFNSKKSSICVPNAIFLGWQISKDGLSMDPNRAEVIQRFLPPKNVKQVRVT